MRRRYGNTYKLLDEQQLRAIATLYDFKHMDVLNNMYILSVAMQTYIIELQKKFKDHNLSIESVHVLNDVPEVTAELTVNGSEIKTLLRNELITFTKPYVINLYPHNTSSATISWSCKEYETQDKKDIHELSTLLSYMNVEKPSSIQISLEAAINYVRDHGKLDLSGSSTLDLEKKGYTITNYGDITVQDIKNLTKLANLCSYHQTAGLITKVADNGKNRHFLRCRVGQLRIPSTIDANNLEKHKELLIYSTESIPEHSEYYDYIDVGRLLTKSSRYSVPDTYAFIDLDDWDWDVMHTLSTDFGLSTIYDSYRNQVGHEGSLLLRSSLIHEAMLPQLIENSQAASRNELNKTIKENLSQKLDKEETLAFNEMKFEKALLTYDTQVIQVENLIQDGIETNSNILGAWLSGKLKNYWNKTGLDDIYFDDCVDAVATNLQQRLLSKSCSFDLTLGNIKAHVVKTSRLAANNTNQGRLEINGIRINITEAKEVLMAMTCYQKVDDYNKFLKSVSSCSLAIHELVAGGIHVSYYDYFFKNNIKYTFHLTRAKGKNYLRGKKANEIYRIKNINSFKSKLRQASSIEDLTEIFSNATLVEMPVANIVTLMKQGMKAYKDALERSQALLAKTVDILKAEEVKVNVGSNTITAFKVEGKKQTYYVDRGGKHSVYNSQMKRICIVDKSHEVVGEDMLVARMLTVANDARVANKVHTL